MTKLYFIAELGQNHQGDIKIAKQMIDELVGTGVKAIKTAKRDIESLPKKMKEFPYINENSFGKNYYEHRQALEFSFDIFFELKKYAESKGFDFISSFTDIISFEFLKKIGLQKIKIASQRTIDEKLLNHIAKSFHGTIYMSSGMSDIKIIDKMIDIFKNKKKYIMQCTSVYPCANNILHLRVLKTYRKRYKKLVDGFGFSGHNMSIAPDIAAYALGATIIERHFTLDKKMKGSDHAGSLEIKEIKQLLEYLHEAAVCLGNSKKYILPEEQKAIDKLRMDLQ